MKLSEVAQAHGFDEIEFERYLNRKPQIRISGFTNLKIADEDVEKAVNLFIEEIIKPREAKKLAEEEKRLTEEEKRLAEERAEQERIRKEQEKKEAISKMLISSGFNFEGYRIVKYSGYISGDDAVQIPRTGFFEANCNGQNLTDALVKIRIQAIKELKEAAYELGCNAVVGVDFDYITLEPETASLGKTIYQPYVICVTANGNAVVIEKE